MHAHRIDVLDGADGDELAPGVADDSNRNPPAREISSTRTSVTGDAARAAGDRGLETRRCCRPGHRRCRPWCRRAQHTRVAELLGDLDGFPTDVRDAAAGHLDAELFHRVLELLAILAAFDGIDLDADLDAVLVEDARLGKLARRLRRTVRPGWEQRVGTFERDSPSGARTLRGSM